MMGGIACMSCHVCPALINQFGKVDCRAMYVVRWVDYFFDEKMVNVSTHVCTHTYVETCMSCDTRPVLYLFILIYVLFIV